MKYITIGVYILCLAFILMVLNCPDLNYGLKWGKCTIEQENFRPHWMHHFHKSKKYLSYHDTPCDCMSYGDIYDKNYKRDERDFIEY